MSDCLKTYNEKVAMLTETAARVRLSKLFDEGNYRELDRFAFSNDKPCEVVCGYGYVNGAPVLAFAQDKSVNGGAMGKVQGDKIKRLYDLAAQTGTPIVGMFESEGAHVDEGLDALNAYGELISAAAKVSGVVPQIAIVLGTCIGSQAVFASMFDYVIMTENAEFSLNSAFIAGDNVGTAESASKNGTAAIVTQDEDSSIGKAVQLLSYLPSNNLDIPQLTEYVPSNTDKCEICAIADADTYFPMYENYGKCADTGFARINGISVGIVAVRNTELCSNGAAKIARFVRSCDAFSLPIVTLVDCGGFAFDNGSELNGSMKYVAMLTHAYAEATTVKITVVTGKAYGAVYTAFAGKANCADAVFALENAEIAALAPDTAVQFMQKDKLDGHNRSELENEYLKTVASPFNAAEKGLVDDVITRDEMADRVISALDMLQNKRVSTMNKKHSNIQL